MRRVLYMALYWMLSVLMLALTVSSLGYSFPEALLVGTMFLPGALAAKFLLPGISFSSRTAGIWHLLLVSSAILVMEFLLLVLVNMFISGLRQSFMMPDVIVNPVFVAAFVALLVIGDRFLDRYLSTRCPEREAAVTFYSERKKVSLLPSEILYVESNDTEVCLYATGCRRFRNRTCISQWEAILGNGIPRAPVRRRTCRPGQRHRSRSRAAGLKEIPRGCQDPERRMTRRLLLSPRATVRTALFCK